MKTKKIMMLLSLSVAVLFIFSACTVGSLATESKSETVNETSSESTDTVMDSTFKGDAYNFKLMDTEGNEHSLEDFTGKKVYIKFWATWCPSCLEGLAELGVLHEQTKDREDIVILTVVAPGYSGEKSATKFIEWYNGQELKFTVLLDEGGDSFYEYGIRAVPSSFFIDSKGNLAESKLGHVGNEEILETLDSLQ